VQAKKGGGGTFRTAPFLLRAGTMREPQALCRVIFSGAAAVSIGRLRRSHADAELLARSINKPGIERV